MRSGEDQYGCWVAVYLPSKERIEERIKRPLHDGEYEECLYYFANGIDAQLDWDILIDCATEALEDK